MSSKHKKLVSCGQRHKRPITREDLFPKKVFKELERMDPEFAAMKMMVNKAFPDPQERLEYIRSLIAEMDRPSL